MSEVQKEAWETYLNEKKVAVMCSIKLSTLRNWRVVGRGPTFVKLPNSTLVRYRLSDVREFMEAREVRPGDEAA
ncbi:MAG: helix-turn-helix transcriptional regulator [Thermoleophilia bacterium]